MMPYAPVNGNKSGATIKMCGTFELAVDPDSVELGDTPPPMVSISFCFISLFSCIYLFHSICPSVRSLSCSSSL